MAVLLLIHGHSLLWGSGNPYDGSILAFTQDLIVVTVNYRLGAFGKLTYISLDRLFLPRAPLSSCRFINFFSFFFLVLTSTFSFFYSFFLLSLLLVLALVGFLSISAADRTRGNFGLFDVIAVLQWIRDNIRSFGGDPDRVTLAGHGLGAEFVNLLLLNPLARGKLHIFYITRRHSFSFPFCSFSFFFFMCPFASAS